MKSSNTAYLLWLVSIFGWLGLHRFYLNKPWTALLWIFTFGLFGIGSFMDFFTLSTQVEVYNLNKRNAPL